MHANTPDALLLDHWRSRRDADAFAELVARYGPLVYSACLRVLRSTSAAEDAAQDCFVELLQTRARVRSLPAFLHTTATRRAVDRLRSERSRADREARFAAGQPITIEATWDDVSAYVDEAIAALPEKLQRPIVLRFLQGRSYAEIASDTGVPASTIQYQLKQGIETIREHLTGRGLPVSAAALAGMLGAIPTQALPVAVTAHLGAMALAGASTMPIVITSSWGAWLGIKSVVSVALVLGTLLPAAYVLSREKGTDDAQEPTEVGFVVSPAEIAPPTVIETAHPSISAEIDNSPSTEATVAASSNQISGTVLDAAGAPAPDAKVVMTWNGESWSGQSDQTGAFSIPLPEGFVAEDNASSIRVALRAQRDIYHAFSKEYDVPLAGLSEVTLRLEPTSAISGKVVDTDGNPLPGWRVNAMGDGFWANTITTDKGEFNVAGIRPGDFTIHAQDKDGRRTDHNGGKTMTLEGRMTYTGIILTWPQTDVSLSGFVTDQNGQPVAGVKLSANYSLITETGEKPVQLVARSDNTGRYDIAGLPATDGLEVDVQLSHHAHLQAIRYGVRVDGHEENFTMYKCPSIRGHVLDAVTRESVASFRLTTMIGQSQVPGFTDDDLYVLSNNWDKQDSPDGAFAIQARGFNDVRVAVAARGYVSTIKSLSNVPPGAEVEDVEILLDPARPLAGIVVDKAGLPLSGARIFFGYPVYPGKDTHVTSGWKGITQTDNSGNFTLTEYPPSLSIVSAYHDDFAIGWSEAGGASPLRITLEKGNLLEGTVTLDGMPLENNRAHINLEAEGTGMKITFSGDGGAYRMENTPAGSFVLSAGFHEGGLRRYIRRAIKVERGKTVRQDFDFQSTGTAHIEGVLHLDEQPVPESLIRSRSIAANGDTLLFQTSARGDGAFLLGPIPAGDYEFGAEWIQLKDASYLSPDVESITLQEGETVKHDLLYTSR